MATSAEHDDHHDETHDPAAEESAELVKEAESHAEEKEEAAAKDLAEDRKGAESTEAQLIKPARSKTGAGAGARGPGARARQAPRGGGSLGKSVILFIVIVGGLLLGFAFLAREQPAEAVKPRWTAGQTVDLEITVVRNDRQELACASTEEVGGKHCAFEAANKPWSKGDSNDDKKLLKPYTTTDRIQFTAAGLWSEPGMAADKLPASRFNVKCKYKVDGTLKNLGIRWEQSGQWYPNTEWYAGSVSDCKISP